jgi:hypothetical protein
MVTGNLSCRAQYSTGTVPGQRGCSAVELDPIRLVNARQKTFSICSRLAAPTPCTLKPAVRLVPPWIEGEGVVRDQHPETPLNPNRSRRELSSMCREHGAFDMQWRKLALLVVLVLILLGASLIWSAWQRGHGHGRLPVFIPGTANSPMSR